MPVRQAAEPHFGYHRGTDTPSHDGYGMSRLVMLPSTRPLHLIRHHLPVVMPSWLCASAYAACRSSGQRANTLEAEYLAALRRIITGHLPVAQKREEQVYRFPVGAVVALVPKVAHPCWA